MMNFVIKFNGTPFNDGISEFKTEEHKIVTRSERIVHDP
jgi:hypothetical protein